MVGHVGSRGKGSNLSVFTVYSLEDGSVSAVGEAALLPSGLVMLVTLTEPFGAEVKGIAKRLVDALERVPARHEDLDPSVGGGDDRVFGDG